jgi:hypothetical protein
MHERRNFIKMAAGAVSAAAVVLGGSVEGHGRAQKDFVGTWTTFHTSPIGPFKEFLTFAEGGTLTETNALLHTNSNTPFFAAAGIPLGGAVNASDGQGNWRRIGWERAHVVFRKLLLDHTGRYLGDFWVQGTLRIEESRLFAQWDRIAIDIPDVGVFDLGPETSEGTRIE